MFVYFRAMRTKDDFKQEALFQATIKLVNDIGFVSSSVAKIAKEADVSPATIYVYHKNKEDLKFAQLSYEMTKPKTFTCEFPPCTQIARRKYFKE